MRVDLNPCYRALCTKPKEESDTLFGDKLSGRVKEIGIYLISMPPKVILSSWVNVENFVGSTIKMMS